MHRVPILFASSTLTPLPTWLWTPAVKLLMNQSSMTSWFFLLLLIYSEGTSCSNFAFKSPSSFSNLACYIDYSPVNFTSHTEIDQITPKSGSGCGSGKDYRLSSRFMEEIGHIFDNETEVVEVETCLPTALDDEGPFNEIPSVIGDLSLFLQSLKCPPSLMTGLTEAVSLSHAFIDSNMGFITEYPDIFETILKAMIYSLLKNEGTAYLELLQHFNQKLLTDRDGISNDRLETMAHFVIAALFRDEVSLETVGTVILDSFVFLSLLTGVTPENGAKLFLSEALDTESTSSLLNLKFYLLMDHLTRTLLKGSLAIPIDPISDSLRVSVFALCFEFVCKHKPAEEFFAFLGFYSSYFNTFVFSVEDILLMLIAISEMNYSLAFRNIMKKPCIDYSRLLSSPPSHLNLIKAGLKEYLPKFSQLNLNKETFSVAPGAERVFLEILSQKNSFEEIFSQMLLSRLYQPLNAVLLANNFYAYQLNLQTITRLLYDSSSILDFAEWILKSVEFDGFYYFILKIVRTSFSETDKMNKTVLLLLNELSSEYFTSPAIERIASFTSGVQDLFELAIKSKYLSVLEILCAFYRIEDGSWELLDDQIAAERGVIFTEIGQHQMMQVINEHGQYFELPIMI